ncbi:14468_t:CDS:2, partial [Racocetra persica]
MSDSEIISAKRKGKAKETISKKTSKNIKCKQKKKLCQLAQNNPNFTQQELAGKFEISQLIVADILAKSTYWLSLDDENTAAQQKRNRLPDHPQLEEILARWFDLALENHITITGLILQEKAKQIANTLDIQNFAVFDGWLQGFKKRYHIVCTTQGSEAASALVEKLPKFRLSLQNNIANYDLFIEIDNKYATGEMPTINELIKEIQESETEEEELEKQKPVTPTQAVSGIDSVLGYIKQLESNFQIDIKVFAELKRMQKELAYLTKKNSKQTKLDS